MGITVPYTSGDAYGNSVESDDERRTSDIDKVVELRASAGDLRGQSGGNLPVPVRTCQAWRALQAWLVSALENRAKGESC